MPFNEKARPDGWEVYELTTAYIAMHTTPREVAELLLELAG
jgi:hypothetical protein